MSSLKLAVALAGTLKIMEFQVCQLNYKRLTIITNNNNNKDLIYCL